MIPMKESIVGVIALMLMLLLIFFLILFACKPWRLLSRFRSASTFKVGDLQRPLVADDGNLVRDQNSELTREYDLEGACYQNEGLLRSARTEGLVKQRLPPSTLHLSDGNSLVLDVISEPSEDISVGQTLKLLPTKSHLTEPQKHERQDDPNINLKHDSRNDKNRELPFKVIKDQRSCLSLEVLCGPSAGLKCSVHSTSASKLPLTLGRVSPSDIALKDSEVSGKHAMINWNSNKLKWELVDMGSLNGTILNSHPVNHPDSGSRHWGEPVELANGDIITLGTVSKVHVQITSLRDNQTPIGIGLASDPMALRRGGKKFPMEDYSYYQWPLPGIDKFGLFGVCDGHGGQDAAQSASKILPEMVANILSDLRKKEKVLIECDASDVLRDAFSKTETCLDYHYEGCTATALLVWADNEDNLFAQCANVGDSACVVNVDEKHIKMSEDHRVTSVSERMRIQKIGPPLKDGETRLCGLNLARMLGDKFLKQQDARFSSEPYVSQVVHIPKATGAFALLASDGFWDVIGTKKAVQLVVETRERLRSETGSCCAEKVANSLLSEARRLRTKDNTSIVFVDFDNTCKAAS